MNAVTILEMSASGALRKFNMASSTVSDLPWTTESSYELSYIWAADGSLVAELKGKHAHANATAITSAMKTCSQLTKTALLFCGRNPSDAS